MAYLMKFTAAGNHEYTEIDSTALTGISSFGGNLVYRLNINLYS